MESRMALQLIRGRVMPVLSSVIFGAGCLRLMNHQIVIYFDARFIALQNHWSGNNIFATVQTGPC